MSDGKPRDDGGGVDPEEFLRALLNISPEDAKEVREQADGKSDNAKEEPPNRS